MLTGRFELIEGELVNKMGQNAPHAQALRLVVVWLTSIFGPRRVQGQLPIEVAQGDRQYNQPEPDVAVLPDLKAEYGTRHPRGDELVLIVEVADSSSRFDLSVKAALYARAGVPEYWVLDVPRRVLVSHRGPVDGTYSQRVELTERDFVSIGDSRSLVSIFYRETLRLCRPPLARRPCAGVACRPHDATGHSHRREHPPALRAFRIPLPTQRSLTGSRPSGPVMGMDWHSSGITTSVIGALKRGLNPRADELGLYVCGGRGRHSRNTPAELRSIAESRSLEAKRWCAPAA